MLSHKKYKQLADAFKTHVHDEETLNKLLYCVQDVTGYSEDKKTHAQVAYEKVKAKRVASGQTSWTEARKKHYEENKAAINQKRVVYYHQKKQQQQHADAGVV